MILNTPLYVFRAELYRKASQRLWSQWLSFLYLNNTHFFEASHRNPKNFMMSGKVGTFSKQNGICKRYFLLWGFCIPSFKAITHAIDKQSDTCRRYLLLQGLYVSSVETTTYVCNRFNTSFCTKDHKTHLAISCYILLHQAARGEGKNSLRKLRDILVSDRDRQRFFIVIIT